MKGLGTGRTSEKKHWQRLEEGIDKKKKKEKSIKGCGRYRKVISHWFRGGSGAWACQEERAEGNLKTEKSLCLEHDMLVEDREKRKCAECREWQQPQLRNTVKHMLASTPMKSSTTKPTHKPGTVFVLPEWCTWRRDTQLHELGLCRASAPRAVVLVLQRTHCWADREPALCSGKEDAAGSSPGLGLSSSGILLWDEPCREAGWDKWATRGCLIILRDSKLLPAKLMCQMPNLTLKGH